MQAIMESLFDAGYLAFAVITGFTLLRRAAGRRLVALLGAMSLILGVGDAFHLVPRVMNYWMERPTHSILATCGRGSRNFVGSFS